MKNYNKTLLIFSIILVAFIFYFYYFIDYGPQNVQKNQSDLKQEKNTLAMKTNSEGAVEVSVAPKDLSENAKTWDFEISLNTHTAELNEDLTAVSVLVDESEEEYKPISWEGTSSGGHHRSGILKFNPISPRPKSIKLKISQIGEINERIFEWNL